LPNVSAAVNFEKEHLVNYDLIVDFLSAQLPGVIIYGNGHRPHGGGVYLRPKDSARSLSHVLQCGTRFGVADHYRGHRSRYGYIHNHLAVIVRQIYHIHITTLDEVEHEFVCAVVQPFKKVNERVAFPWEVWFVSHTYSNVCGVLKCFFSGRND
jgi:hypothetical protein